MIVTRSWLNEFIDLKDISNDKLYETFNAIGLEVGRMEHVSMPSRVVIGQILSCEKHPDADKLNVCQVNIGLGTRQIVCGAANVVNATFVAVATVGTVLPDGLEIKPAKLRGVESDGMICSASELGLPNIGSGIMILDDSIGELEPGRELREYDTVNDTIFELELTPNRGDCLSIYGVARDLCAALGKNLIEHKPVRHNKKVKLGISREASLNAQADIDAYINCNLVVQKEDSTLPLIVYLRLAMINIPSKNKLDDALEYLLHTTGVILQAYDADFFRNVDEKIVIELKSDENKMINISNSTDTASVLGVYQDPKSKPDTQNGQIVLISSYIHPNKLAEMLGDSKIQKDSIYYNTSRGSNPDFAFGLLVAIDFFEKYDLMDVYDGVLSHEPNKEDKALLIDIKELYSIIGQDIEKSTVTNVLQRLGFKVAGIGDDAIAITVPMFRPDICNIQDIAEEVVRIIGIDQIESKPLCFNEHYHADSSISLYRAKKAIRNRAASVGFFESISYIFSDNALLEQYGFETINNENALLNPIVQEMNTLRSTLLVNLLLSAKRNINYTKKLIPLFEIGRVFDVKRNEKEKIAFVWSGQSEQESIINHGKPSMINMPLFLQKLGFILSDFRLEECSQTNKLIHPYQSANILIDNKVCGYVSKLHPVAQEEFGLYETFIAELDFEALMPKHVLAKSISNFQGVYKDLSILISREVAYSQVKRAIDELSLSILSNVYPIDTYEDKSLGNNISLTIRLFIQSGEHTLEDSEIEHVTEGILTTLQNNFGASLR
ncbi:MAG: phenylalanine--tRNA ligase subunit beta [Sulfurovaceae bacterium]|nr:phenylalanine--tRNA ligase subunit beta [Sulfurovaceae bacterium]